MYQLSWVAGCAAGSRSPAALRCCVAVLSAGVIAIAKVVPFFQEHIAHVCIVYGSIPCPAAAVFAGSAAIICAKLIVVPAHALPLIVGDFPIVVLVEGASAAPSAAATTPAAVTTATAAAAAAILTAEVLTWGL